jgi:hypothetical protein
MSFHVVHSIAVIDMINHSSSAALRNTALEQCDDMQQAETATNGKDATENKLQRRCFVMRAGIHAKALDSCLLT